MHRIDGAGAAPGGFFTEGNPDSGVPATVVTDDWANAVQEEIIGVMTAAGIAPDKPDNGQLVEAVLALVRRAKPVGTVIKGYFATAPVGTLFLRGGLYSRTTYADLWAHAQAIGLVVDDADWLADDANQSKFSNGNGSTTFRVPDLQGEFIRVKSASRGLGSREGDQVGSHAHDISLMEPDDGGGSFVAADAGGDPSGTATTGATGGSETRPRNTALAAAIYY